MLNNAGYALISAIEDTSINKVKNEFDTNVFGMLRVIQAEFPVLRKQKQGHILGGSVADL